MILSLYLVVELVLGASDHGRWRRQDTWTGLSTRGPPEDRIRPRRGETARRRLALELGPMASRTRTRIATVTMILVALVVAHDLVFLAAYGAAYGEALAHTGHDHGWTSAVVTVLVAGLVCLVAGLWQLRRLSLLARLAGDRAADPPSRASFGRRWLRLAVGIAMATIILFVAQENVEHLGIGEPLPGLGVLLSPEYPNAIPIIVCVASAVALVGALFGWRFAVLAARLRATGARHLRPSKARPRTIFEVDRRPGTLLGAGLAPRAPPPLISA